MKLLTLNTHSWIEENPLVKMKEIADTIIKHDFDIIALQEINQKIDRVEIKNPQLFHPTPNQTPIREDNFAYLLVQYLREQNNEYHWSWCFNHIGYGIYEEGVALLSKEPIAASSLCVSFEKNTSSYKRREILIGETEYKNTKITVLSCHYSWWNEATDFELEWKNTLEKLNTFEQPIFLMGDFNCPANIRDEGYDLIIQNNLLIEDTFKNAKKTIGENTIKKNIDGWKDNEQDLRIDYIFTSNTFSVETYEIIFNGKNSPIVSDHFGIAVDIK